MCNCSAWANRPPARWPPQRPRRWPSPRQSGGGPLEADALHELVALLRSQSLSAVQRFRSVAPQLRRQMGAARFEQLQQQIDNLQFDAAADVLSQGQALPA